MRVLASIFDCDLPSRSVLHAILSTRRLSNHLIQHNLQSSTETCSGSPQNSNVSKACQGCRSRYLKKKLCCVVLASLPCFRMCVLSMIARKNIESPKSPLATNPTPDPCSTFKHLLPSILVFPTTTSRLRCHTRDILLRESTCAHALAFAHTNKTENNPEPSAPPTTDRVHVHVNNLHVFLHDLEHGEIDCLHHNSFANVLTGGRALEPAPPSGLAQAESEPVSPPRCPP